METGGQESSSDADRLPTDIDSEILRSDMDSSNLDMGTAWILGKGAVSR